jgi:putative zinc finger protein
MTCDTVHAAMTAFLDGELIESERAGVEAHARECDACARRLARLHATQRLVRSAAPDWSRSRALPRVPVVALSMAMAVAVPLVLLLSMAFDTGQAPLLPSPDLVDRRTHGLNLRSMAVASDVMPARDCRVSGSGAECAVVVEPVACESIDECGPPPVLGDFR